MANIAVVILNYNSWQETLEEAQLVNRTCGINYEDIIIVDNNSPNNSEKELRKNAHKGYIFIESGTNKGYAAGNNIGLKYAYEHGYDYAWILNNDILIDDNMVTLNRVEKSGDIYNVTSQEFITNNEERKDTAIKTEVYTTALMEKQMRITFAEGAGDKSVKVIRPNQLASKNELEMVLADNSESVKYYVYGVGELAGIYDKASYAIQKAQQISGVVISSDQKYVWEKGNRDLAYSIEDVALSKEGEETSLEACERYMKTYDAQKVDLTGCTLDQVLYVINRGCPVIALTSADHAILLTGYTKNDITYIDPENGESQTVSISEMEGMVSGSGNTFIGYIK